MDDQTLPQPTNEPIGFNIAGIYSQDHAVANNHAVEPLVEGDPAGN